jgi:hypothetical protein
LDENIEPVESLSWSANIWKIDIKESFKDTLKIILVVTIFFLISGLMISYILQSIIIFMMAIFLCVFLSTLIIVIESVKSGWTRGLDDLIIKPNQGIIISLINGIKEGLVATLISTPIFVLLFSTLAIFFAPVGGWPNNQKVYWFFSILGGMIEEWTTKATVTRFDILTLGWAMGIACGLFGGAIFALRGGLGSFFQHYILRFLLWREGKAPLRYVDFLENCCELLLLRRFGGAYQFYHITLRDYFATLTPEQIEEILKPDALADRRAE